MKALFLILLSTLSLIGCKDSDESDPVANFEFLKDSIFEGNNLEIKNLSLNGNCVWTIESLNLRSETKDYNPFLDSIGNFNLKLQVTNGNGKTAEFVKPFTILKDTLYRLCKRKAKTWVIKSLIVDNKELIDMDCKKDDQFVLKYFNSTSFLDSFFLNHGNNVCDSQDYLLKMPATGIWKFNSKRKTLDLNIDILNSPMVFNYTFNKLYKNYIIATDAKNNSVIHLISN